jgi:hypothetical protein
MYKQYGYEFKVQFALAPWSHHLQAHLREEPKGGGNMTPRARWNLATATSLKSRRGEGLRSRRGGGGEGGEKGSGRGRGGELKSREESTYLVVAVAAVLISGGGAGVGSLDNMG